MESDLPSAFSFPKWPHSHSHEAGSWELKMGSVSWVVGTYAFEPGCALAGSRKQSWDLNLGLPTQSMMFEVIC